VKNDWSIGASWSYDNATRLMVSYDTPQMVQMKAQLIGQQGLGGAMYWESSGDRNGSGSLISTVSAQILFLVVLLG
jgi:chitinase